LTAGAANRLANTLGVPIEVLSRPPTRALEGVLEVSKFVTAPLTFSWNGAGRGLRLLAHDALVEILGLRNRVLVAELEVTELRDRITLAHESVKKAAGLVAWGIDTTGKPHLLGLEPGSSESTDAWADFLRGMVKRGLRPPLLVISDGGAGLIGAVEIVLERSLRQRCLIHRCRNLLAKVPKHTQGQVKAQYWAIFDGIEAAPGDRAVAEATRRARAFSAKWGKLYPAAVSCLMEDLDHLTTYLRFPREHWKRIRHSNFIERTFGETRRRVKVIGRLPGERSCLSLVWAVLDRASKGWRGVDMSPRAVRLLQDLRRELFGPPAQPEREEVIDEAVTPAA
jgi:putative transposase